MTYSLFWDVSQPLFVDIFRRIGTTIYPHPQGLSFSGLLLDCLILEDGRKLAVPKRWEIAINKC